MRSVATPFRKGDLTSIKFLSFLSLTSFYLVLVGIEDYCCILKNRQTLHITLRAKGSSHRRELD